MLEKLARPSSLCIKIVISPDIRQAPAPRPGEEFSRRKAYKRAL
jgi:hypothetical protein